MSIGSERSAARSPAVSVLRGLADADRARVMVLGDSHGTTSMVTGALTQAAEQGCAALVSVGDFGVWLGDEGRRFLDEVTDAAREAGTPVVVVPGNHDDYDQIDAAALTEDGWNALTDWILAAPRGRVWRIAGHRWMGFGGTASIDGPGGMWPQVRGPWLEGDLIWEWDLFGQPRRRRAVRDADLGNWWRRERITEDDVARAKAAAYNVSGIDVMVTHDIPGALDLSNWVDGDLWPTGQQQRDRIQQVVDAALPRLTVSGHWHRHHVWHSAPWRIGGRAVALAADVSPDGDQWVIVDCERDSDPRIVTTGRANS